MKISRQPISPQGAAAVLTLPGWLAACRLPFGFPQALTRLSAKNDAARCRKTVQLPTGKFSQMIRDTKPTSVVNTSVAVNRQQVLDRAISKSRAGNWFCQRQSSLPRLAVLLITVLLPLALVLDAWLQPWPKVEKCRVEINPGSI